MAVSYQRQSAQRKMVYFGIIAALLTVSIFVRLAPRLFAVGATVEEGVPTGGLQVGGLKAQALGLKLREQDLGKVELTSSAVRLMLTGSRGFAICGLWIAAREAQKKHEYNELDLLTTSITKLQPYFVSPWLFQSWNLAYNVARESDLPRDKYFFVARGMELLAEGEQRISGNPDLRLTMGTYYQSKFNLSDQRDTLRSLFQLSCIDPVERDPARFYRGGERSINLQEFEAFCRLHPRLIRRLLESPDKGPDEVLCNTPEKVVGFLREYWRIPSRFADVGGARRPDSLSGTPLRDPAERFPILPPPEQLDPNGPHTRHNDSPLDDDFDTTLAAGSWFSYAQQPLREGRDPKFMNKVIFRGWPALAQAEYAHRLEKEGWFDDRFDLGDWFKHPVLVREGRAGEAWDRAYHLYLAYGRANRIYAPPEEVRKMTREERLEYDRRKGSPPTNIDHWVATTEVERTRPAVTARRLFYQADRMYWKGYREEALRLFEEPAAFGPPDTWLKPKPRPKTRAAQTRRKLQQVVTVEYVDQPLKDVLADLSGKVSDLEIILPPSLEPKQKVTLRARDRSIEEVLQEIFKHNYLDYVIVTDPKGPKEEGAVRIRTGGWKKLFYYYPEFRADVNTQEESYTLQLKYLDLVKELRGPLLKNLMVLQDALTQAGNPPGRGFWTPPPQAARVSPLPVRGPFDDVDDHGEPFITAQALQQAKSHPPKLGRPR